MVGENRVRSIARGGLGFMLGKKRAPCAVSSAKVAYFYKQMLRKCNFFLPSSHSCQRTIPPLPPRLRAAVERYSRVFQQTHGIRQHQAIPRQYATIGLSGGSAKTRTALQASNACGKGEVGANSLVGGHRSPPFRAPCSSAILHRATRPRQPSGCAGHPAVQEPVFGQGASTHKQAGPLAMRSLALTLGFRQTRPVDSASCQQVPPTGACQKFDQLQSPGLAMQATCSVLV